MHLLKFKSMSLLCAMALATAFTAKAQDTRTVSTYKENVTVERTTTVQEVVVQHVQKPRYKCAIFVTNRAERIGDNKVAEMQDFLTSYITDKGFDVVAREDVLNAVSGLSSSGPNKGDAAAAGADRDKIFSNNTSLTRLSQNLDCDYALVISIASYGVDTQKFRSGDLNLASKTYQLRASYKIVDAINGASITAGNSVVKTIDRIDPASGSTDRENVVDDLLDGAAADMAVMLAHAINRGAIHDATPASDEVAFNINVSIANLIVPAIVKDDEGHYSAAPESYPIDTTVSVEVDGVTLGTSGLGLKAKPGLHKLRLFRAMLEDYEATVKISQGTNLDIKMELSADGRLEWRRMSEFMNAIRHEQQLTDGEVKVLEGYAQKLSQSGMRVDIRDGVKHPVDVGMYDADNAAVMGTHTSAGVQAAPATNHPAVAPAVTPQSYPATPIRSADAGAAIDDSVKPTNATPATAPSGEPGLMSKILRNLK